LNVIVSGGTGSGKTTLLNVISSFIPTDERICTVEDSAELQLNQPHVVRLETAPALPDGSGEITIRDLVRNALRMRPERIVSAKCAAGGAGHAASDEYRSRWIAGDGACQHAAGRRGASGNTRADGGV
jgi:pilus assembly protein CpaF